MARKKISEFKAKKILYDFLEIPYSGISIDINDQSFDSLLGKMEEGKKYVLKVDQGVKQRKKKGLVSFNATLENVKEEVQKLKDKGFSQFILEEFIEHENFPEHYLAVERIREGKRVHYSTHGGIDIEENKDKITTATVKDYEQYEEISKILGINVETFESILTAFDNYYFSFLEINPLVVMGNNFFFLDTAVEVDSAAEFFVSGAWSKNDFVEKKVQTTEELEIQKLKEKSPASFSFEILNPNGSLFLLLSGGGASLVTADEVYNQGKGELLANYGEYSGSPTTSETYIYTKNVLSALLHSNSSKKALIISGGVANFTDVRITFKGIIKAMSDVSQDLKSQNVKVFVRRGGPHQQEGLKLMKEFLEKENLLGELHGPELVLTNIVKPALEYVS
jgi:succinyl-CoA synthetase beta subunit